MAGILAATISSSDSLLAHCRFRFRSIYQGLCERGFGPSGLYATRITLVLIAVLGMIIALDENSVIFTVVSLAWAGFGATFGPIMLFSLFWKRVTRSVRSRGCSWAEGWFPLEAGPETTRRRVWHLRTAPGLSPVLSGDCGCFAPVRGTVGSDSG